MNIQICSDLKRNYPQKLRPLDRMMSKIFSRRKNVCLLVNSGMNFDDDTNKVDERERINGFLDFSEVPFIAFFMDSECIGREEFVLGCLEHRVFKAPNEFHPFQEFLLRVLRLTTTRRVHLLLVSWS